MRDREGEGGIEREGEGQGGRGTVRDREGQGERGKPRRREEEKGTFEVLLLVIFSIAES